MLPKAMASQKISSNSCLFVPAYCSSYQSLATSYGQKPWAAVIYYETGSRQTALTEILKFSFGIRRRVSYLTTYQSLTSKALPLFFSPWLGQLRNYPQRLLMETLLVSIAARLCILHTFLTENVSSLYARKTSAHALLPNSPIFCRLLTEYHDKTSLNTHKVAIMVFRWITNQIIFCLSCVFESYKL